MKQFQYTKPGGTSGTTYGPFSESDVADIAPVGRVPGWAHVAPIGDTCQDSDGDVWMRLPDLGEAPVVVTDQAACDERLERIATATLQGLITGVVSVPELAAAHAAGAKEKGFTFEQYLARDAVVMAKALIAELDKQA